MESLKINCGRTNTLCECCGGNLAHLGRLWMGQCLGEIVLKRPVLLAGMWTNAVLVQVHGLLNVCHAYQWGPLSTIRTREHLCQFMSTNAPKSVRIL